MLAEKQLKKNVTTICRNASKEKYNLTKSEMLKWEKEFTEFAKVYMMENFGVQLRIPIKVSNRLKSTCGYFRYSNHYTLHKMRKGAIEIVISADMIAKAMQDPDREMCMYNIYDTLKHELIHYGTYMTHKNFHDGDFDFEDTLRQLKVSSSGSTNIGKRLNDVPYSYYHQEYKNGGYELVRHDYVYE